MVIISQPAAKYNHACGRPISRNSLGIDRNINLSSRCTIIYIYLNYKILIEIFFVLFKFVLGYYGIIRTIELKKQSPVQL